MKEIKITRTIEEVGGYEATDGTFFKDREECIKYENTAKSVIEAGFKACVIGIMSDCDLFLDNGCDDYTDYIVCPKNQDDLKAINLRLALDNAKLLSADDIGKEIVLFADYDKQIWGHNTLEGIFENMKHRYESAKSRYSNKEEK